LERKYEEEQRPQRQTGAVGWSRQQTGPERTRKGEETVVVTFTHDGEREQTMQVRADITAQELTRLMMERMDMTGEGYLVVTRNGMPGSYAVSEKARYEVSAWQKQGTVASATRSAPTERGSWPGKLITVWCGTKKEELIDRTVRQLKEPKGSYAIEIRDGNGALRTEYKIAEGWSYKLHRTSPQGTQEQGDQELKRRGNATRQVLNRSALHTWEQEDNNTPKVGIKGEYGKWKCETMMKSNATKEQLIDEIARRTGGTRKG
jgi:hypothetical protein